MHSKRGKAQEGRPAREGKESGTACWALDKRMNDGEEEGRREGGGGDDDSGDGKLYEG